MVNYVYYTEKDGQGQRHMAARPIRTREEYMALRDAEANRQQVAKVRRMMAEGAKDDEVKREKFRLVKFAYNDLMPDGTVKNASHPSSTFFHDIDLYDGADVEALKQKALQMKEELGLLELSASVSGGLHLICRRQQGRTILENQVRVATLLQAEMDTNNDNLELRRPLLPRRCAVHRVPDPGTEQAGNGGTDAAPDVRTGRGAGRSQEGEQTLQTMGGKSEE